MIPAQITNKVLIVGTDFKGRGGIAVLLNMYSTVFTTFNYACSHRFTNKVFQIVLTLTAYIKVLCYCLFSSVKIVHIHTASYFAFFRDSQFLLLAKLFGKRVILHLHGGKFEEFYNRHPKYCRYICEKADCIVGVSNYFGDLFRRLKLNRHIEVIYNAVEPPLYPFDCPKKKTLPLNILFLGAIADNKGIFDLIRCVGEYRDYFVGKIILHIGGVGNAERLKNDMIKYGIENIVTYYGWLNKEEKHKLLSKADIYIQPSYFESLGIAIIEAMSYAVPIVASNTGGIPELVEDGVNGVLIRPGSTESIYSGVRCLMENSELRSGYGRSSLKKSKEFTLKQMETKLVNLYNNLLR